METKDSEATVKSAHSLLELVVHSDFSTSLNISGWVILGGLSLVVLLLVTKLYQARSVRGLELDETEFGIGNQKVKLRPNLVDSQIAYKIWVELSTRKIGIAVDLEKDMIVEVYNSWYEFFSVTRELIKEIPASKIKRKDTERIVNLSIDVLNRGIRPHLTEWQARFRRWYENELLKPDNESCTPQEIQKKYPNYMELTGDMVEVNQRLIKYRKAMYSLVVGQSK